ncbi:MAG: hypothetical protein RLZZ88_84 [Actinomycetota bacterium]
MDSSLPICLIPARGGSKGVNRKNLRTVGGVPLVARSIHAALASGVMSSVTVSTDDDEIAAISKEEGAAVLRRPAQFASDEATSESVIEHFLRENSIVTGHLIMVQPTTPFLEAEDLVALAELRNSFDTALTVSSSHVFLWRSAVDRSLSGINHDAAIRQRRQDIDHEEFAENGGAYLMSIKGFYIHRHRFFGRIGYVAMPYDRSLEIDTEADLRLANVLHSYHQAN